MAKQLGIDIPALERQLGIDWGAEARWAQRVNETCASSAVMPSKCSSEGKSLQDSKALADTGNPIFQNNYAHRLDHIVATPEAERESIGYHMAAAGQGLPHAQVTVGWRLLHGLGVERNAVVAFEWNMKGARQGHPEGANNVAFQYRNGIGVAKNLDAALDWYGYAAVRGSLEAYGALLQMRRDGN
jgi:TPR repeat protein